MVREATIRLSHAVAPQAQPWPKWARRLAALWVAFSLFTFLLVVQPLYRLWLTRPSARGRKAVHTLNAFCARWVILQGNRIRVTGRELVPPGPVMFVANHRSFLDIPLCHVAVPRPFRIVGKAELSRVPLFGWMYARQHILLERERTTSGARALVAADHVLREGDSLLIYPEGTTQHGSDLLAPFKEGAFLLAHRRSVPIVPIVLRGTRQALPPDGRFLLQPGRLYAEILPAVEVTQFVGQDALAQHVYQVMIEALQREPAA